ncbi:MAG: class II fructose-bisphosphate aldolase [Chloroflexota bacterium]|nr:class II fructose-bisphosphate aldolase [Chloroflexota bacterium]
MSTSITGDRIDGLVEQAVFGDEQAREESRRQIRELAASQGIYPASIQGLYEAAGKGAYHNKTVPAINIRGMTYQVARAVFRAALKHKVGAFIFELARSEIGYTRQRPAEYVACVLAAAIKEGYQGPVFIQGDHFQMNRKRYSTDPKQETETIRELIREAVNAGFLNIDIDASTLVDLEKDTLEQQQEENCRVTAEMTRFIRSIEPEGVTISVGGEIGEVGKQNSTVEDLRAFMSGYRARLEPDVRGISKISVQTGTTHGGVVLPDGAIASVALDFDTLKELSKVAREEYGMGGAVQHGASTLPDEAFHLFPEVGTVEVHLATGFQNIIYDSPHFPQELTQRINQHLLQQYSDERKSDDTEEQFLYKTRKKAFGDFKKEMWSLPVENLKEIGVTLEERFVYLFQKLNVVDTRDLVNKHVVK